MRRGRQPHGLKGFTLVELLVCIAIIALLIALLLPSLARARFQAKKVSCLANVRSIALAAHGYVTENQIYPPTDGSWLYRVKNGPDKFYGIGYLLRYGSFGEAPSVNLVQKALFCPDARPSWNLVTPKSVYNSLFVTPSANGECYSTYTGKFCTFVGYNTFPPAVPANPTQANLYYTGLQSAVRMSPILATDYVFNSTTPWTDQQQAHQGEGVNAAFHDGSATWINFKEIDKDYTSFGGMYNVINPYGNFWRWARVRYGDGSTSSGP